MGSPPASPDSTDYPTHSTPSPGDGSSFNTRHPGLAARPPDWHYPLHPHSYTTSLADGSSVYPPGTRGSRPGHQTVHRLPPHSTQSTGDGSVYGFSTRLTRGGSPLPGSSHTSTAHHSDTNTSLEGRGRLPRRHPARQGKKSPFPPPDRDTHQTLAPTLPRTDRHPSGRTSPTRTLADAAVRPRVLPLSTVRTFSPRGEPRERTVVHRVRVSITDHRRRRSPSRRAQPPTAGDLPSWQDKSPGRIRAESQKIAV